MDLYNTLMSGYIFDNDSGQFYRRTNGKTVLLRPTGTSNQISVAGKKYKVSELVYLLKEPTYQIGTGRVLAVDYKNPTYDTVKLKNSLIDISNYRDFYYYDESTDVFRRKYSFKGVNVAGTSLKEVRNNSGTLTVVLDKDVEVQKATLVWHWYTGQHISSNTTRFVFIDNNPNNTRITNLVLNTSESCYSNNISPMRLNHMYTVDYDKGTLVPNYPARLFQTEDYLVTSLFNHTVGVHRILYAMYNNEYLELRDPKFEIDHIDHNRQNNTRTNLRKVESRLNKRNRSLNSNNTSGHNGIQLYNGKYRVEIASNYLGLFSTLEEALMTRDSYTASNDYHSNHGLII